MRYAFYSYYKELQHFYFTIFEELFELTDTFLCTFKKLLYIQSAVILIITIESTIRVTSFEGKVYLLKFIFDKR